MYYMLTHTFWNIQKYRKLYEEYGERLEPFRICIKIREFISSVYPVLTRTFWNIQR